MKTRLHLKCIRHSRIDYPSGSALEFAEGILYVTGDDANRVLCLDQEWNPIKEITLFDFTGMRVPKPDKHDLECAALFDGALHILGSGSLSPQRDVAFVVGLKDEVVKKIDASSFYSRIRSNPMIRQLNLEGFTRCGDRLLLFNRGNNLSPNHLIITDLNFLHGRSPETLAVIPVKIRGLGDAPLGISGACYDEARDVLLLSASAEDTDNAYDDGEIKGSALAVVYQVSQKLTGDKLVVDEVVDLAGILPAFAKQKVESICITNVQNDECMCTLVADNDEGNSALFELLITPATVP